MTKRIYLDHAATTALRAEVLEKMLPYLGGIYGNPSGLYTEAREAKKAVEAARKQVAAAIGANSGEVFFTSGGTEADNWAIAGAAYANKSKGNHIITSAIEHHAVLYTCQRLEKEGFAVTYLPVDEYGRVSVSDAEAAITDKTTLITIMLANNEIGTIQPISSIGRLAKERGILFHTDAVQAVGAVPIDVNELNVDLMSVSAHKFYGPKGIGVLYVRKGAKIANLLVGGGQEYGRRAGTENTAGIVGLGAAIEIAARDVAANSERLMGLRDMLIEKVLREVSFSRLNGHPTERLANNVSMCFEFIEGESLLLTLDLAGIAASSGSACTSGSLDPSHVLLAIGLPHGVAHGSLRLTLGEENTAEDIEYTVEKLKEAVDRLRKMSPLWEG